MSKNDPHIIVAVQKDPTILTCFHKCWTGTCRPSLSERLSQVSQSLGLRQLQPPSTGPDFTTAPAARTPSCLCPTWSSGDPRCRLRPPQTNQSPQIARQLAGNKGTLFDKSSTIILLLWLVSCKMYFLYPITLVVISTQVLLNNNEIDQKIRQGPREIRSILRHMTKDIGWRKYALRVVQHHMGKGVLWCIETLICLTNKV